MWWRSLWHSVAPVPLHTDHLYHPHEHPFIRLLGIGESKQGLPLGRLSIQILTITMPEEEMTLLNDETIVRVRVDIKGNITLKRYQICPAMLYSYIQFTMSVICLIILLPINLFVCLIFAFFLHYSHEGWWGSCGTPFGAEKLHYRCAD